jgi:hypothetical protein
MPIDTGSVVMIPESRVDLRRPSLDHVVDRGDTARGELSSCRLTASIRSAVVRAGSFLPAAS